MKSALELAMEKTNKMEGNPARKLTDAQKEAIAQERRTGKAKIAELSIMMDEKLTRLAGAGAGPEYATAREELARELASEKAKIEEKMERKIENIRNDRP